MLQRSISLDPEDSRSWFLLGVTQESGRRVAEAETSYRRALSLYPEFADAQVRLAAVLAASGRSAEARAIVTALLARKPGYPGAAELLRQIGS